MIDTARARADTPGCTQVIHFHHSGAALMPAPVLTAVKQHLDLEASIGGYEAAEQAVDKIENTYHAIARLLNCSPDEIAVVENATVAWDMAFYGLAQTFRPGDRLLTVMAEYASNYIALLQVARRTGVKIEVVPNDIYGQLDVQALERMLDERVRLISVTHVPTNGGLVNPAAAVGRVARKYGIPYLLDACQSAGQMPLDVEALGCDMLSATGRKFLRGPRGTGFLYVRRSLLESIEPPFLDLHSACWTGPDSYQIRADARRFESWESCLAAKIGLGVAIDYALSWGLDDIYKYIQVLADALRRRLSELPGVTVRDLGKEKCGIVTFTHTRRRPAEIRTALARQRINVGLSQRSATLLDMEARGLPELVRCPVHYYNTEDELERLLEALAAL